MSVFANGSEDLLKEGNLLAVSKMSELDRWMANKAGSSKWEVKGRCLS